MSYYDDGDFGGRGREREQEKEKIKWEQTYETLANKHGQGKIAKNAKLGKRHLQDYLQKEVLKYRNERIKKNIGRYLKGRHNYVSAFEQAAYHNFAGILIKTNKGEIITEFGESTGGDRDKPETHAERVAWRKIQNRLQQKKIGNKDIDYIIVFSELPLCKKQEDNCHTYFSPNGGASPVSSSSISVSKSGPSVQKISFDSGGKGSFFSTGVRSEKDKEAMPKEKLAQDAYKASQDIFGEEEISKNGWGFLSEGSIMRKMGVEKKLNMESSQIKSTGSKKVQASTPSTKLSKNSSVSSSSSSLPLKDSVPRRHYIPSPTNENETSYQHGYSGKGEENEKKNQNETLRSSPSSSFPYNEEETFTDRGPEQPFIDESYQSFKHKFFNALKDTELLTQWQQWQSQTVVHIPSFIEKLYNNLENGQNPSDALNNTITAMFRPDKAKFAKEHIKLLLEGKSFENLNEVFQKTQKAKRLLTKPEATHKPNPSKTHTSRSTLPKSGSNFPPVSKPLKSVSKAQQLGTPQLKLPSTPLSKSGPIPNETISKPMTSSPSLNVPSKSTEVQIELSDRLRQAARTLETLQTLPKHPTGEPSQPQTNIPLYKKRAQKKALPKIQSTLSADAKEFIPKAPQSLEPANLHGNQKNRGPLGKK